MDFEYQLKICSERLANEQKKVEALKEKLKSCREFTARFLAICAKKGIEKVAIAKAHKSVPASTTFSFGVQGSIFSNDVRYEGWSAIWAAVREMGISGGCGNSNQMQADTSMLVDGVYHLKKGNWHRVDAENDRQQ